MYIFLCFYTEINTPNNCIQHKFKQKQQTGRNRKSRILQIIHKKYIYYTHNTVYLFTFTNTQRIEYKKSKKKKKNINTTLEHQQHG